MLAFVLWMLSKIFRANISTCINFSWRPYPCLRWWCCRLVAKLQAMQIPTLSFGWRKGYKRRSFQRLLWMAKNLVGIWKEVVFLCKCKLMIISFLSVLPFDEILFHFHSIVQIDETLLLLTLLSFFRMWVSRVRVWSGCQTSNNTPFAITIHVKCLFDEFTIQWSWCKKLMSQQI